ncbi:death effector domain-containing protein-like [Lineus longissimus]|uniref:death effector domain-containing protein-like n=1 Tax=Lineus longissimus TaxID=88925 RepID=UPI00315C6613
MADEAKKISSNSTNLHEELHDLHHIFRIVGDQLSPSDLNYLKMCMSPIIDEEARRNIKDGFTFFLTLEKAGFCDESNFKHILQLLRVITRHDLMQFATLRSRKTVSSDPVEEYLKIQAQQTAKRKSNTDYEPCRRSARIAHKRQKIRAGADWTTLENDCLKFSDCFHERKKVTCDIKLRVRAEYCHHTDALQGNVASNRPQLLERQFEKFEQASNILKSRDLGSVVCDIKFTELTYLDAFWRDYINGTLLEALKGVFITDSLKQTVGQEAIQLLVNVDEDDYEVGRVRLLENKT